MAEALAEAGCDLALCSRRAEVCLEAAKRIEEMGRRAIAVKVDITKAEEVQAMVQKTLGELGRIDILVNNAGITWAGRPEELKLEDWKKVLDTNLTGTFLASQAVGRVMIAQKRGRIVNVASVLGLLGIDENIVDIIAYTAAKGGVIAFTRDLAVKWAKYNVNVNAIAPSFFPTKMTEHVVRHRADKILNRTPMGRLGEPEDLKGPIVFLASDASRYVTGQVLVVDGGFSVFH